jgi:hypothetical protein
MRKLLVLYALLTVVAICVGFMIWLREIGRTWSAVDYNAKLASDKEVLDCIAGELSYMRIPRSAKNPRMYRDEGKDPTYWIAFRTEPREAAELLSSVRFPDCEETLGGLEDLPRIPPPAIQSWWPTPDRHVVISKAGDRGRGAWHIFCLETGEVWVCRFSS